MNTKNKRNNISPMKIVGWGMMCFVIIMMLQVSFQLKAIDLSILQLLCLDASIGIALFAFQGGWYEH
jgi:hypothetical protein